MASKAQFDAELTRIKGVIGGLKAENTALKADKAALTARVAELEAQVATGGIPEADESAFLAELTTVGTDAPAPPPTGGDGGTGSPDAG